jgi:hypothetical protein
MAVARAMGRSLRETVEYLGAELPLWEAEYDISPWGPEREDLNAWKLATAIHGTRNQRPPPFALFDRTRPPRPARQPAAESKEHLDRAAATWPGATKS